MSELIDRMSTGAPGGFLEDLVGEKIAATYEVKDSDRGEEVLVAENGVVLMLSCDPGYDEEGVHRTDDRWECCVFDVTATAMGELARERAKVNVTVERS